MELLKTMLKQFGIEVGRFRMDYASASEGDRFAKIVDEMTDEIKKLGAYVKYEGETS
jgi:F420-non-reducing hydrogenase iron-sulfur subunit